MNQLLSVNCVFVTALHRLCGAPFFAKVIQMMVVAFTENHKQMVSADQPEAKETSLMKLKNIINCLLHLFLFQSVGSEFIFDVIKFLLSSFTESDIEVLIFVLHNIGLQLRKKDPANIKMIIDLFNQKKNSFAAEKRIDGSAKTPLESEEMPMDKKIKFLVLELNDIKNNKGSVTMQMRSIEHLQTWLKRDPKLSSELLIKPLEVTLAQVQKSDLSSQKAWWKSGEDGDDEEGLSSWQTPTDWKKDSKNSNEVQSVAKKHHMITDVKKAVFQAIVQSEDYLQAFEQLNRLNLKKTQQREIIRVLFHCCLSEK